MDAVSVEMGIELTRRRRRRREGIKMREYHEQLCVICNVWECCIIPSPVQSQWNTYGIQHNHSTAHTNRQRQRQRHLMGQLSTFSCYVN